LRNQYFALAVDAISRNRESGGIGVVLCCICMNLRTSLDIHNSRPSAAVGSNCMCHAARSLVTNNKVCAHGTMHDE